MFKVSKQVMAKEIGLRSQNPKITMIGKLRMSATTHKSEYQGGVWDSFSFLATTSLTSKILCLLLISVNKKGEVFQKLHLFHFA